MWDAVRLEKLGTSAILLVHRVFETAAKLQGRALGIPALRYVVFPQPRPQQTREETLEDARRVANRVAELIRS